VAVKIRLKRLGKIRSPHYRIVVADSRTKRDGRAIEEIGKYHPKNDPSLIEVDSERAQYWLSVGAQPTEAVVALFKRTGDWQRFSGDTSPSGVEPQKQKKNKTDVFNAALADAGNEPKSTAVTAAKKTAARKEVAAEPVVAAEATGDEPASATETAEATGTAEATATAPVTEAPPAVADEDIEGTPAEASDAAEAGVADADTDAAPQSGKA
jgi:small subunit ribosomal protein S16